MRSAVVVIGLAAAIVAGVWALSRVLPASASREQAETGQGSPGLGIVRANGCLACHTLGEGGGQLAPAFETLRGRDAAYIRRAIVDPRADTALGFESLAGTMPAVFGSMLSAAELDTLVAFLRDGGG